MDRTIMLVPVGPVEEDLLAWLAERLPEVVDRKVEIGKQVPLPDYGFDQRRGQYHGEAVLDRLDGIANPAAERVIGLVNVDCFSDSLNFIFGEANLNGRTAFVALPRLRPSYYNLPADLSLFHERVLKEVVHELGHTWGLRHCADPKCVMHFSNNLSDTDEKGVQFCQSCQEESVRVR